MEANRATLAGTLSNRHASETTLRAEIGRKEIERTGLGSTESPTVIGARLDQLKLDRRWGLSKNCTEVHGGSERKFCQQLSSLDVVRAKSNDVERLDRELDDLRKQLAASAASGDHAFGDPRVGFIVRNLQWQPGTVEAVLAVLFLAVLEIGSGLGLFMAMGHGAPMRRGLPRHVEGRHAVASPSAPQHDVEPVVLGDEALAVDATEGGSGAMCVGDVAKFACARLIAVPGRSVAIVELHANYTTWCQAHRFATVSREVFEEQFVKLALAVGFRRSAIARQPTYLNLAISEPGHQ